MKYVLCSLIPVALLAGCASVDVPPEKPAQTSSAPLTTSAPLAARPAQPALKSEPAASGHAAVDYPLEQLPFAVKSPAAVPALTLFPKPFATGTAFIESEVVRKDGLYKGMVIPIHERVYPTSTPYLLHKSVQTSDLDGQPLYLREISLKWNGLIDLHSYVLRADSKTISLESTLQTLEITSNKWPKLEKGASFSYKATYALRIPNVYKSKMQQTGSCTVTGIVEGQNAAPGKAYEIECISRYQNDPVENRVTYHYDERSSFLYQVQAIKGGILDINRLREHRPITPGA